MLSSQVNPVILVIDYTLCLRKKGAVEFWQMIVKIFSSWKEDEIFNKTYVKIAMMP